jgi:hypothetical protein
MALKPDRAIVLEDISYFVNNIVGTRMERGGIVCASGTPGSGSAMDSSAQTVEYHATSSGRVAVGLLMIDFVNVDQSRQILNPYIEESQIGTKALLLKKGWVVTNMIVSGQATGSMPTDAYASTNGNLTAVSGGGLPLVGKFMSRIDAEGYAKVHIDII